MGKAVSVWVMGVAMVLLGGLIMVGAMQEAYAPPVDSGVGESGCVQELPHYDYVGESAFHAWVHAQVGEHVNTTYSDGVWYADGVTIGYARTEDAAIYNHEECVR